MGTAFSLSVEANRNPDCDPQTTMPPSFDPLAGFPRGRKERKMEVTLEQMENAGLETFEMDFCAHKLMEWKECVRKSFPFANFYCHHNEHAYQHCEFHDQIARMKEWERERRLLNRMKRKREAAEAAVTAQQQTA